MTRTRWTGGRTPLTGIRPVQPMHVVDSITRRRYSPRQSHRKTVSMSRPGVRSRTGAAAQQRTQGRATGTDELTLEKAIGRKLDVTANGCWLWPSPRLKHKDRTHGSIDVRRFLTESLTATVVAPVAKPSATCGESRCCHPDHIAWR